MPQRRIAATGFGGRPGLSILSGMAEGELMREKMDRENQRQALLNRVAESQMESMAQSRRHAQEDQDFERSEAERAEGNRQAAAAALRPMMVDLGFEPSIADEMMLGAIQSTLDATAKMAQTDAAKARGRASDLAATMSEINIKAGKRAEVAQILMSRPDFFEIAFFETSEEVTSGSSRGMPGGVPYTKQTERPSGGISELTRKQSITKWAESNNVDPVAATIAYDALREQAEKIQASSGSPYVDTAGGDYGGDQVRDFGDKLIDSQGGIDGAIEYMKAKVAEAPSAEEGRLAQQVLDALLKRAGGDGSGIAKQVNAELNARQ